MSSISSNEMPASHLLRLASCCSRRPPQSHACSAGGGQLWMRGETPILAVPRSPIGASGNGALRARMLFGIEFLPQRSDHVLHHARLLESVGQLVSVRPRHGVFLRTQLTQKCECGILRCACAPAAETILPPAHEEVHPLLVVREADLHLHLLATRHTPVIPPGIVQYAMHQRVVLFRDRPSELAPDHVVRDIRRKSQVWKTVQKM